MAQRKFIIDGGFQSTDDSIIEANLEMTGNILPTVDSDGTTGYDLGSPTKKWRDLYLSSGSLYIDGQKVMESDAGTIVVQADPDQSLTTKVTGTGVLTFQSATSVNMAATLQMQAGKKITDAGGNAVVFGDKVDMDNNQIINVGAPTADGHAATKLYVDGLVGNISTSAITEGDSEIEIADLGTGTVGITVDGSQRFALSATALALTVPVTVNGATLATNAYVDSEISTLSAAVAAGAYGDSDVEAVLDSTPRFDAGLRLGENADLLIKANNNGDDILTIENNGGQAFFYGQKYLPADNGQTDLELEAKTGGKINVNAFRVYNVGTPTDATDATNKSYVDAEIAALDFNNVAGGIAVTGGDLDVSENLTLSGSSELQFASSTIVGDDPDATGNPAVCATSFRPTAGNTDLNLVAGTGGVVSLTGGDVSVAENLALSGSSELQFASSTIVGDDPDNAGNPAVCATSFRPTAGNADLNLRAGVGGTITFGDGRLTGVGTPTANTDATNKSYVDTYADQAEADAKAYTDTREVAITSAYQAYADQSEADALTDAKAYTDTRETAITTAYQAYADQAEVDAKAYADSVAATAVANTVDAAPATLDTLNELAAALGDDANFSTTITNSLATKATITYVDNEVTALEGADTALGNRVTVNEGDIVTIEADIVTINSTLGTHTADIATNAANIATNASDIVSGDTATLNSAQAYADQAELDAVAACEAKDVVRAAAAATDATNKANAAQTAAEATAQAYCNGEITTLDNALQAYADQAEADAISAAALDATTKADAAQSAAEATAAAALSTAVANIESSISTTRFHSSVTDVTNESTLAYTFTDLQGAEDYAVYVNRMLVRPSELTSVNLSTGVVTFASSVIADGDEIEVTGWKFS
jgi:hypothetical protein